MPASSIDAADDLIRRFAHRIEVRALLRCRPAAGTDGEILT